METATIEQGSKMLEQSRFYTFIDQDKKFALYFLEGQKLIYDLVLTQTLRQEEFEYFRSTILGVQLMLGYLKNGENFCFYIDSDSPCFRLKIEMNAMGLMRGMIFSDSLDAAPDHVSGKLRMLKLLPSSEMPYQSIIELDNVGMNDIINLVLTRSYQVNSRVFISDDSDQSFMLNQLPLTEREEPTDLEDTFNRYVGPLSEIMKSGLTDQGTIIEEMANIGFKYLASKRVAFKCGCSKEQMIENVKLFSRSTNEEVFFPGKSDIEVTCEYCKAKYRITRRDVAVSPSEYQ